MLTADINPQPNTTTDGKRRWLYPVVRKGKLYAYRSWLSYAYLALFFAGPFIRVGGEPLLLFNVMDRHFVLLGQVFWPQDFFIFVLAMLAGIVCIVLFTIAFGRIFCGWMCPQTIFMEMVFRKIEIWIEGDAKKRRKLDEGPWTSEKIIKKTTKHVVFILLSFLIANTFLAYITGSENLIKIITEPVKLHWSGFISIWIFTLAFYIVYSQVREIVCTVICPYGRLQGVLTDKDTLNIAYNYQRGEPRGKLSKKDDTVKGDCVDCGLCVDVCPTGIDIRNGSQLECINCTACIDACNQVMEKIHRELNLIGFYSENVIKENKKLSFNTRMKAYSAVIVVLLGVLSWFVLQRSDIDVTVLRSAGTLYQEQPGGYVSNLYNADVINKTNKRQRINLVPADPDVKIKFIQAPGVLDKGASVKIMFFVMIPAKGIHNPKTDIQLNIIQQNKMLATVNTTFIGPVYGD
ncbi:cytochrome c oxidase accessory protein CcoG [Mucilaginibacter sp. KACC 22063]|uniref:cytochrome c oxidase accessory protein CcoG n=1 Tax=Mucilaginibacter sp. KACC 22063 TaxID=3025666 RepID=UPI0023652E95|nr:cytochrome c oxidase accessory protein CcoG [Mucilaginibacter sp. KACC 22063]WDF57397.1 cytochrome c oxidase accessory protein CcoG [Mucilaginibacter sp. KACC 22063]